jgi:hypothetical protein
MTFIRMTRAERACLARQVRAGLQRTCIKAAITINSIAAPAIFYWARGLKHIEIRAKNDEFWRCVA